MGDYILFGFRVWGLYSLKGLYGTKGDTRSLDYSSYSIPATLFNPIWV